MNYNEIAKANGLKFTQDCKTNLMHVATSEGKARCNSRFNTFDLRDTVRAGDDFACLRCENYLKKLAK